MAEQIRFYLDEHVPESLADALRLRGFDVLTTQEAGMGGRDDPDQLEFAASRARVIVTQDSDYAALHHSGIQHAGIAYIPKRRDVKHIIGQILLLAQIGSAEDMRGRLEYL